MSSQSVSHTPSQTPPAALFPAITVARLLLAWGVVAVFQIWGESWLKSGQPTPVVAIACFTVLFLTIMAAAFGVVREADHLAHQLGEPYGTLILTLSVVSIEVILIAAVMLGTGEAPTIGRDSIFAVMMIIMNLVMGICLLVGGIRYGEQEYNAQGALSYISMILLLTGTALVLPNTLNTENGSFPTLIAAALACLTLLLYLVFLALQTTTCRRMFIQPAVGQLNVPLHNNQPEADTHETDLETQPIDKRSCMIRSFTLIGMMLPIVLLAHHLAILVDLGVKLANAPIALGGVIIAVIVFTPESITAVKAALRNEIQRVVNLCLGAFVSTVGLTIPAVLTVGLLTGKLVIFGIAPTEMVLLYLTIGLSALTLLGQRTTAIQGLMHLVLFALYGILLFAT